MYLLFLALWIIFNGRITTEVFILGLIVAGAMYAFVCKFMNCSPKKEIKMIKKIPLFMLFFYHLVKEIVKANFATMHFVVSSNYEIEPALVQFKTNLKTDSARFLLANAITMTPGTITVDIEDSYYYVHCLDKTFAEGLDNSIFVQILEKIERE